MDKSSPQSAAPSHIKSHRTSPWRGRRVALTSVLAAMISVPIALSAMKPAARINGERVLLEANPMESTSDPGNSRLPAGRTASFQPVERRRQVGPRAYFIETPPFEYSGDALDYVAGRVVASNAGDAGASYEIHLRTSSCKRASSLPDQGTYDAYAKIGLGLGYLESMAEELDRCMRLLASQDLLSVNWLEMAADQGLVEAQLMYALDPRAVLGDYSRLLSDPAAAHEYRSRALEHLNAALDTGSLNALAMMGDIHAHGILAPQDTKQAYAYKLALNRVDGSVNREQELSDLRRILSLEQRAAASRQADELVKRCCQ